MKKKDLEKIVLCDVPNTIFPDLKKSFLDMMHNSGHPNVKLEKEIDFTKLYLEKFNWNNFFLNEFLNKVYDF